MSQIIPKRNNNQIDFIQALRGIAAMMVVLRHSEDFFHGSHLQPLIHKLFWPGAFGVDLFFIISGFIIVHTCYDQGKSEIVNFIQRRLTRIWPMYVIFTLLFVFSVKYFDLHGMTGFSYNPSSHIYDLKHIFKSLFFIPDMSAKPVYFGPPSLPVGWTLNYEMYFYAIFAIGMFFGNMKSWFYGLWFSVTLFIIPTLLNTIDMYTPYLKGAGYLNFMMQGVVWEFVLGGVMALLYRNGHANIYKSVYAIPIIASGLIVVAIAYYSQYNAAHGIKHSGLFYCYFFFTLVICHKFIKLRIKFPAALITLGNASFSLYLTHPIAFILSFKIKHYITGSESTASFSFLIFCIIFTLLFAISSFYVIERNLSKIGKVKPKKQCEEIGSSTT